MQHSVFSSPTRNIPKHRNTLRTLVIEVDVTDEDVHAGKLMMVAWSDGRGLRLWRVGDPTPHRALQDAADAAHVVVGYDLARVIAPHLMFRFGLLLRWPRVDLRSMLGLDLHEVLTAFAPPRRATQTQQEPIARRLTAVRRAWNFVARG